MTTLQQHTHKTHIITNLYNNIHTQLQLQLQHDNPTENIIQEKKSNKNVTNQRTIGLISADRSNKATLLLTIPRSKFKSSAKDLSSLIFEVIIQGRR